MAALCAGASACQSFSLMKSRNSIGACAVRVIVSGDLPEIATDDRGDAGHRDIDLPVLQGVMHCGRGDEGRFAATELDEFPHRLTEHTDTLVLDPLRVCHVLTLREEHLVADRLPPEDAHAHGFEQRLVNQGPELPVGGKGGVGESVEIEQEWLFENVDGGNLVGELIEAGDSKLHRSGRDRAYNLRVIVRLSVVENLDRDRVPGALLDLLLELGQALTEKGLGDRHLQCGFELHLLRICNTRERHDASNHRRQHSYRAHVPTHISVFLVALMLLYKSWRERGINESRSE